MVSTQKTVLVHFLYHNFHMVLKTKAAMLLPNRTGPINFVIIVTQPETNTGVTFFFFFFCFFPIFVNIFLVFILLLN